MPQPLTQHHQRLLLLCSLRYRQQELTKQLRVVTKKITDLELELQQAYEATLQKAVKDIK